LSNCGIAELSKGGHNERKINGETRALLHGLLHTRPRSILTLDVNTPVSRTVVALRMRESIRKGSLEYAAEDEDEEKGSERASEGGGLRAMGGGKLTKGGRGWLRVECMMCMTERGGGLGWVGLGGKRLAGGGK
jgi:hypothetical protein